MVLAVALDDAKANQIQRVETPGLVGSNLKIPFFGGRELTRAQSSDERFRGNPDLPHASFNHYDSGRPSFSGTHFHTRDQFQVVIAGTVKIGRHVLTPYGVHFTRAYTPYGPLVTDGGPDLTLFILRAHLDAGSQHLPEELDQLRRVPDRQPLQVTSHASFPAFQSGTAAAEVMLQAIPGMKNEYGLAGYTLSVKPNAKTYAPDPAHGDGQYLAVVKGSLMHADKEHKAPALVFVGPKEGPFQVHAGAQGLETLVLNFPQAKPCSAGAKAVATAAGFKKWQCTLCSFAYDEALGMPEEGIPAGTRWKDVPDAWSCPDCSTSKSDFQMVEV